MDPDHLAKNFLYLTALNDAVGRFEAEIRAFIPAAIVVKDRQANPAVEVHPHEPKYAPIHDRFTREVSSPSAILLLQLLYKIEKTSLPTFDDFHKLLGSALSHDRLPRIKSDFPKIDQTTVGEISGISKTIVGYRLEDLAKIGLVTRSDLGPPDRKHVRITQSGIIVIENAIRKGTDLLTPVFVSQQLAVEP